MGSDSHPHSILPQSYILTTPKQTPWGENLPELREIYGKRLSTAVTLASKLKTNKSRSLDRLRQHRPVLEIFRHYLRTKQKVTHDGRRSLSLHQARSNMEVLTKPDQNTAPTIPQKSQFIILLHMSAPSPSPPKQASPQTPKPCSLPARPSAPPSMLTTGLTHPFCKVPAPLLPISTNCMFVLANV